MIKNWLTIQLSIKRGGNIIISINKNSVVSINIAFLLIVTGFSGILLFENIINNVSVGAAVIYVDIGGGGDYTSIQEAIDNANSGDAIIVANGTYYESITINKTNLTLIGNSSTECKISHHYDGTNDVNDYAAGVNITAAGTNMTGFNITVTGNYTYGIRLNSSSSANSRIFNITISTSGWYAHGIFLHQTTNNTIKNNTIETSDSFAHGIFLFDSSENNFTNNNVTINVRGYGIFQKSSNNNRILNNTITILSDYSYGLYLDYDSYSNYLNFNKISTQGRVGIGIYLYEGPSNNILSDNKISSIGEYGYGIYLRSSTNNTLINNSVNTSGANAHGIYLNLNSNNNTAINNTIKTQGAEADGIRIYSNSDYNNLTGNNITTYGSISDGIFLFDCLKTEMNLNRIETVGDGYGIYFYKGTYINLSGNNLSNCGIKLYGPWLYSWDSHYIDTTNVINSKPVYYYKNIKNVIVPGAPGEVIIVNCTNVTVSGKIFNDGGVYVAYSNDIIVENSVFNFSPIFVTSTSYAKIIGNTLKNTSQSGFLGNGIYVGPNGKNNDILDNELYLESGYGIVLYSDDSNVMGNTIVNKNGTGISISYCSNDNLKNNIISTSGESGRGIELWSSINNNLINNILDIQNEYGIYLRSSSNNNQILNNTIIVDNDNAWGIGLLGSDYCKIANNTINTNGFRSYGIRLEEYSDYCDILNNEINTSGERGYGISIYQSNMNAQNNLINNSIATFGVRGYGIYLYQSSVNKILSNSINTFGLRGDGIYLQQSADIDLTKNRINTSNGGYGFFIYQESNYNNIVENIINTKGQNGHGIFIRNSNQNSILNCEISTSGTNAFGFYLDHRFATLVNTTLNSGANSYEIKATNNSEIHATNCIFNTVHLTDDGGGVLKVKNYLDIRVYYEDGVTPITDADVKILDNNRRIYASPGYSGTNPSTNASGQINTILITDCWYLNSNSAKENVTLVMAKKTIDRTWEEARANVDMSTSHTEIFIATDILAPSIPSGLNAHPVPNGDALNISWNLTNDTKKYDLWYKDPSIGKWNHLINITHPKNNYIWSNKSLINGIVYNFKIRALDKVSLASPFTEPISVKHRDYIAPGPPTNLIAHSISEFAIELNWTRSNDLDVEGYRIYFNQSSVYVGGNYEFLAEVDSLHYQVINLTDNTTYYFMVTAFDEANNTSPFSNEAVAKTKAIPKQPKVISSIPQNNSANVPINTSIIITFNMPMNTTSVAAVLDISPFADYTMVWTENNSVLQIEFKTNLRYNTSYTLTIGMAQSTIDSVLDGWPFVLTFRTEEKIKIKPTIPTLTLTFPNQGVSVKPGENIIINGTSSGMVEDTVVIVTLNGITETSLIGSDGNWSVYIKAPTAEGNYTIKVSVGNISDSVSIIVKDSEVIKDNGEKDKKDKDKQDDKGIFGMGATIDLMIIVGLVIIIIILILFFIIMNRKSRKKEEMEEVEKEEVEAEDLEAEELEKEDLEKEEMEE